MVLMVIDMLVKLFLVFGFIMLPAQSFSQTQDERREIPKIGLVLGGGGAKGFAHIGIIKVLEEQQIPVDVITGTSMGAIIGSLYASGHHADAIESVARDINWGEVFYDKPSRRGRHFRRKQDDDGFLTDYRIKIKDGTLSLPAGLIQGQKLFLELAQSLSSSRYINDFDQLPIPLRVIAADIETGAAAVLKEGDIATAVFASMALPGIVPPVERDGQLLVDGGIANNVPVDQAKLLGVDILIVVSLGSKTKTRDELTTFIDVIEQTQTLFIRQNTKRQLALLESDDILITPEMGDIGTGSFHRIDDAIKIGEQAAKSIIPILQRLRLPQAQWQQHLALREKRKVNEAVIKFVRTEHNSGLSDQVIKTYIDAELNQPLDTEALNEDIADLYGLDVFDRVSYEIVQEEGEQGVLINAESKRSGTDFFRFGLALDSDFESESFQIGTNYTSLELNELGGEVQVELDFGSDVNLELEFYQPLDNHQRFFIEPGVVVSRNRFAVSSGDDNVFDGIRVGSVVSSLDVGTVFGNWGELRAGLSRGTVRVTFLNDNNVIPSTRFSDTALTTSFTVDTLDNLGFPKHGLFGQAAYVSHEDSLGGDLSFQEINAVVLKPYTIGRHTFIGASRFSGSYGRDAGVIQSAELGGFLELSGFGQDDLSGRYAVEALGAYYYRLNEQSLLFDIPIYLGGSIEAGNVYENLSDLTFSSLIWAGSVFIGVDSPVGPVFLGFGYNDEREAAVYFSIGSFF